MTLRLGSIAWPLLRVCKRASAAANLSGRNELPPPVVSALVFWCLPRGSLVTFHPARRVRRPRRSRPCAVARTTHASKPKTAECRPLGATWERGRPFRLRSHSASSSARTCDVVPALGSPQVCGPCGRIPPTLTRSSERLGHGFSPRFCRRAPKAREASKGGARQAAPVGRGGRGMWVPGSQVSRPSGSLAAGMKSVRPCSRHRLAPRPPCPTTRGMLHTLHFFQRLAKRSCPASSGGLPAALLQLLEHETRRVLCG